MNRRQFFVTAAAAAAATGLAACSSGETTTTTGTGETAIPSGPITVYSGQHESLTNQWAEAFTKETGIKVNVRRAGDIELANQLVAEGDASPADVLLTENSPAMALVENADLFAELDEATLEQVPEAYRPSSGKWTGAAARATVFAYNKDKLTDDQLPKSIFDLQKPEWKDRWSAALNADFQAIMAAMLELEGEEKTKSWLNSLKNDGTAYQNNIVVYQNVNTGQVDGGVTFHYYWFRDQANTGEISNNVKLHFFKNEDPGAFVSLSGAGVLKGSKNPEAAQKFVAFVTGEGGQGVLNSGDAFEYAVGNGAKSNPELPPLDSLQAPVVDTSKFDSKKVTELMTQAGLL